ncbi:hypothetical protein ACIP60_24965, partial [Kitasatospora sp. NPDC088783]
GGGETTPPAGGGGETTPPAGGGGETTPPAGGGGETTPPAGGGKGVTPVGDKGGSTEAPSSAATGTPDKAVQASLASTGPGDVVPLALTALGLLAGGAIAFGAGHHRSRASRGESDASA